MSRLRICRPAADPRRFAGRAAGSGRAGHVAGAAQAAPGLAVRRGGAELRAHAGLIGRVGDMSGSSAAEQTPVHGAAYGRSRRRSARRARCGLARQGADRQDAVGQGDDLGAGQGEPVGVAAGRDDAGVSADVPDAVGERRGVAGGQVVEQAVDEQQFGLVHGGGGQPGPAGHGIGCGPQRHVGPRGQLEPVQDGGGQHGALAARQAGPAGGLLDQAADPDAGPGPAFAARDADPGPRRRPGRARYACPRRALAARRSWARPRRTAGPRRRCAAPAQGSGCRARADRTAGTPGGSSPTAVTGPSHAGRRPRRPVRPSSAWQSVRTPPTIPRFCAVTWLSSRQYNVL